MPRSEDTSLISPTWLRRGRLKALALITAAVATTSVSGCDRIKTVARKVARSDAEAPAYLAPPAPTGSGRLSDGRINVQGSAPAGSRISLRSPEGDSAEAAADSDGHWSVILPPSKLLRLYAFNATLDGRIIRAEGALCVLPDGDVLVLRAGSGALMSGGPSGLSLADVDFDGGGGVAASGLAAANSPVRLTVDGAAAGIGQADARGRYVVMGLDPRRAPVSGVHAIGVQTPAGLAAAAEISLTPAQPLAASQIYRADAVQGGWRIDWRLPGGGTQTSVVLSPPVKGVRP